MYWDDTFIIKMKVQKSTRRKKQDCETGNFVCLCSKAYLSYAAAYTHIKYKHNLDKQFLDNLVKPARQKLPRGRPKQVKQRLLSNQYDRLSVIQTTILRMHAILHTSFPQMILPANKVQTNEQLQTTYRQLLKSLNISESFQDTSCPDLQFIEEMNRHFVAEIASKLKFVILTFIKSAQSESEIDKQPSQSVLDFLNSCNLWRVEGVNQLILDSFWRWRQLKDK